MGDLFSISFTGRVTIRFPHPIAEKVCPSVAWIGLGEIASKLMNLNLSGEKLLVLAPQSTIRSVDEDTLYSSWYVQR
jgi:hypothetical protein